MTKLSVETYQKMVDEWVSTIGVCYFSELTNLAQLVEEVGEVARIMSRVYGDQSFKRAGRQSSMPHAPSDSPIKDHPGALADELADVMFVLVCIANQTGVNLSEALEKNLEKKTRRDEHRHRANPKLKG